jgi:hypothetical protein
MFSSSSESDPDDELDPLDTSTAATAPPTTTAPAAAISPVAAAAIIATKSKPSAAASAVTTGKSECCTVCDKVFTKNGLKLHKQRCHKPHEEETDKKLEEADKDRDQRDEDEAEEEEEDGSVMMTSSRSGKVRKPARSVRERKNPPLKKLFECAYCQKRFSHLASMKVRVQ